jgi:HprK-related kinase A
VAAELYLRTGPFTIHIETSCDEVMEGVALLYDPACVLGRPEFCDYHVEVWQPPVRRFFRPQAVFRFDGRAPFLPGPKRHASPMLEWGMNWVIASTAHQYLIMHAAVVERHGLALVLPAPPGSGKSTLCAGLVFRGWRLLSDEMALIEPGPGHIVPLARPISLKNESIDVIRRFAPDAVLGPPTVGSIKGTIVLVKPPRSSVLAIDEPALPRWIAFPRYDKGARLCLTPRSKAATFVELGENAMNYNILGEVGFDAMSDLIDRCDIADFVYSDLEEAVTFFTGIADRVAGQDAAVPFAQALS